MEAPVIRIGPHAVTLARPRTSAALALARTAEEQQRDHHEGYRFYGAAALAVCWPRGTTFPCSFPPPPWRPGQSMLEYGADVLDRLCEGQPPGFVLKLLPSVDAEGVRDPGPLESAYNWAMESCIVSGDEVRAAKDFSGAPDPGQ